MCTYVDCVVCGAGEGGGTEVVGGGGGLAWTGDGFDVVGPGWRDVSVSGFMF